LLALYNTCACTDDVQSQGAARRTIFDQGSGSWQRPDHRQRQAHDDDADGGGRRCDGLKLVKKVGGKYVHHSTRLAGAMGAKLSGARQPREQQARRHHSPARIDLLPALSITDIGGICICKALKIWDTEHIDGIKSSNDTPHRFRLLLKSNHVARRLTNELCCVLGIRLSRCLMLPGRYLTDFTITETSPLEHINHTKTCESNNHKSTLPSHITT
jgi:hypothetical protein